MSSPACSQGYGQKIHVLYDDTSHGPKALLFIICGNLRNLRTINHCDLGAFAIGKYHKFYPQPGGLAMSREMENKVFYFSEKGPINTEKTLEIALACSKERNMGKIVVASSTGETALRLHEMSQESVEIIAVTYGAGSRFTKEVEKFNANHDKLLDKGIHIVRGILALSGVEKTFVNKYKSGFIPLNIVADTLRMFSQGVKVCVEIAVMAAEHGHITPDEEVVVVAGSGHGADTAVVIRPAFASNIFETKIRALLCMPV